MTVSIYATGTTTAVIGTTHNLSTAGPSGTYQFAIDLTNMADGDSLEIRCSVKIFGGKSSAVVWYKAHRNTQGADNVISLSPPAPCPITGSFSVSILQTTGTGRAYDWCVMYFP